MKTPLLITPGSEQVRATIERDGLLADLEAIGATVLANVCGPCIGQWQRDDITAGETNTIVSSFNRNFPARNDGNAATLSFIGSPETVTAMALTGRLDVDFVRESITAPDGTEVRLVAPVADELPSKGFDPGESGFVPPSDDPASVEIVVAPDSDRLELLTPFLPWDGNDYRGLQVLMKAAGKCTTDHISPGGEVAEVPRPPHQHLRQPLHRREQRVHARGVRHGRRRARRLAGAAARPREAVQGRRDRLGRDRRRELRRGLVP